MGAEFSLLPSLSPLAPRLLLGFPLGSLGAQTKELIRFGRASSVSSSSLGLNFARFAVPAPLSLIVDSGVKSQSPPTKVLRGGGVASTMLVVCA